jgi:outer membrane receptor for Fe3+-dicitrate
MRRLFLYMALASIVLWPLGLAAQSAKPVSKPHTKSIEVKHFTNAAGIQLSQDFSKSFYASFLAELQRLTVAERTVAEGAAVVDTDRSRGLLPHFLVLEGAFLSVQQGREKDGKSATGFANIEMRFFRMSNHKEVDKYKFKIPLHGWLQSDERKVAESAGIEAADEVRRFLYPAFKIMDFCC